MEAPRRKYVTEFSLNMRGSYHALLQQDAFLNTDYRNTISEAPPLHIYMICSRPRIAWIPESLKFDSTFFCGTFTIQKGNVFEKHDFRVLNLTGKSDVKVVCEYPHTEFQILHGGVRIAGGKVANAMISFNNLQNHDFLDFEVLYVGQSYGDEGSRVALDRLQNHSTLQGIYAEAIQRSPDKEIWILLWAFEPILITSFDSRKPVDTSDVENKAHMDCVFKNVLGNGMTEQQMINFTEAAIIRYFRPTYNVIFKDSFPNPAHRTYSECYDIDLNAVNVELDTTTLRTRLWSHCKVPEWIHFATFPLHSAADRKNMFDFDL